MITRDQAVMKDGISMRLLQGVIAEHSRQRERLCALRRVYDGAAPITRRRRAEGLPNNRLAHAYPRYIVQVASAYLTGHPVRYECESDNQTLSTLQNAYACARADNADSELARQASVYGKGVELVYADENARLGLAALDPRSAFVVYDTTVQAKPLFGVSIARKKDEAGNACGYEISVYTASETCVYACESLLSVSAARPVSVTPHFFGAVPLVEYWNNEEEKGDFETVLPLIDAYDTLQSDRVNNQEQLTNALLVIYGARLEEDALGRTPAQALRQDKLLYLPDRDAGAEYLTCNESGADTEALRAALQADIHKFSMIPDLTDQNFAMNQSGVAMQYKLLGLEHMTRVKERWFREGLRTRLFLAAHFLYVKGARELPVEDVLIRFTRSLPIDQLASAQMVRQLQGIVPDDVLLTQLPFMEGKA